MESLYAYVEVTKILFDTMKSLYMHIEFTKIYFDPFEPSYAYAEVTKILFDTMESLYTYAYQFFISFQHKTYICYTTQILNEKFLPVLPFDDDLNPDSHMYENLCSCLIHKTCCQNLGTPIPRFWQHVLWYKVRISLSQSRYMLITVISVGSVLAQNTNCGYNNTAGRNSVVQL